MSGPSRPDRPRILLVRLSAVGDVADCLPAAASLRCRYPEAHIAWAVDPPSASLVECLECPAGGHFRRAVDRIFRFPRGGPNRWRALGGFLAGLADGGFDVAIDLHGNARSGLVSWASKAPLRIGFPKALGREGNFLWTGLPVEIPRGVRHRTLRSLALLEPLAIPLEIPPFRLEPGPAARESVRRWHEAELGSEPFVLLHAGASAKGNYKRWLPERFAELGRRLSGRVRVVFFQGPSDLKTLQAVSRAWPGPFPATPLFDLPEVVALLETARLVVGSDSGPLHLAHVLGRPTVDIFGPKDPADYGPLRNPSRVLYKALPCSPCRNTCCPHRRCLDLVSVEEAEEAAIELLGQGA